MEKSKWITFPSAQDSTIPETLSELSDDERDLVNSYRGLSPDQAKAFLRWLENTVLAEQEKRSL